MENIEIYLKEHTAKLKKDKLRFGPEDHNLKIADKENKNDLVLDESEKDLDTDNDCPEYSSHLSSKARTTRSAPIYVNLVNPNILQSDSSQAIECGAILSTRSSRSLTSSKSILRKKSKNSQKIPTKYSYNDSETTKIINLEDKKDNELYKNFIGCSKETPYSGNNNNVVQRNFKENDLPYQVGMGGKAKNVDMENIQPLSKAHSKHNNGAISKSDKNSLNKIAATSCTISSMECNNNVGGQNDVGKIYSGGSGNGRKMLRGKMKDDMEQWITDTFYSYFPSLNGEVDKKRHQKQLEYQDYVKQISNEAARQKENNKQNITNENSKPFTSRSDKDEMQIIVTNPTYQRDSFGTPTARPGSNRHKLLADLRHTDISKMMYDNAVQDRNQENLEKEAKKKKEYQTELMRQIEEKRRSIEMLKEKEKMEDEALTRKLEEQLRTIKLEEELEKQKIQTERTRFEIEHNKLMRQKLLSKLENDQKYLNSSRSVKSENDKNDENLEMSEKNQVYKFFTNSARREREIRLQSNFQNDILENFTNDVQNSSHQDNCQHTTKISCPFCDVKLKNYDSWCTQCQRQVFDDGAENRSMICENCEKEFRICASCDKTKNYCEFCYRKRNICLNCIKNFCIHCGNTFCRKTDNYDSGPDSDRSFQILRVNYDVEKLTSSPEKPYSFNKKSIVQPNLNVRNGDVIINRFDDENSLDKSREITYEKMKKYKNNYKDLIELKKKKKSIEKKSELDDMPLLGEVNSKIHNIKLNHRIYQPVDSPRIFSTDIVNSNNNMEHLNRKWEIPAVEKRTIGRASKNSPIVLTQLGAVRRALQMDRLQFN